MQSRRAVPLSGGLMEELIQTLAIAIVVGWLVFLVVMVILVFGPWVGLLPLGWIAG